MKIAAYTIALNEEQFVKRWYESVKDADYLLIADTGSTDDTVKLAKDLGINVVSVGISPWRFDDARNAALSHIPLDIDMCISLDMDEVITPNWRKPLEDAWVKGITRPKYKHVWSWQPDGSPGLEFAYDHIHTRKNYRWKHPVHETLNCYGQQEISEFIEEIETHHYPDQTKSRSQYLPLLAMSIKEDPYSDRNAYYYARELFFYGLYDQAIKEFKRHLSLPTATWGAERSASYRYLAKCDKNNAKTYLLAAIEEDSSRREAKVELSSYGYDNQDWELCYEQASSAIQIKDKPLDYLCEDFAWNELPYDLASISAWNLGKTEEAILYIKQALQYSPGNKRLQNNLIFFEGTLQNKE